MTYKNGIVSVWKNGEVIDDHNVICIDTSEKYEITLCFLLELEMMYPGCKIELDDTGAWHQTDFNIFLEDE